MESPSGKIPSMTRRPQILKPEIVGFDQDQRLFDLRVGGEGTTLPKFRRQNRKFRPELQIVLNCSWIESRQYSGLK